MLDVTKLIHNSSDLSMLPEMAFLVHGRPTGRGHNTYKCHFLSYLTTRCKLREQPSKSRCRDKCMLTTLLRIKYTSCGYCPPLERLNTFQSSGYKIVKHNTFILYRSNVFCNLTNGKLLNQEMYTHRVQKVISLHLFKDRFGRYMLNPTNQQCLCVRIQKYNQSSNHVHMVISSRASKLLYNLLQQYPTAVSVKNNSTWNMIVHVIVVKITSL